MSLTLNMVGGGASANVFAFIVCTYPSGSICTATNGSKTLTASDTSGNFVFSIPTPASIPEVWTVSCTNGTKVNSAQVTITNLGQSESVELSYELALFENGVALAALGAWQNKSSCSLTDGEIVSTARNGSSGNNWAYENAIDVSSLGNYSVLKITMRITQVNAAGTRFIRTGFFSSQPVSGAYDSQLDKIVAATDANVNTDYETYDVDISNVSGSVFLGTLSIGAWRISKIWLE